MIIMFIMDSTSVFPIGTINMSTIESINVVFSIRHIILATTIMKQQY